jgi:hypothetical protein
MKVIADFYEVIDNGRSQDEVPLMSAKKGAGEKPSRPFSDRGKATPL